MAVLAVGAALFAGITARNAMVNSTEQVVDVAVAIGQLARAENLADKHDLMAAAGIEVDPEEVARISPLGHTYITSGQSP